MNNKVNFTFVGSVVLAIILSMVFTVYWLMRPADGHSQKEYLIYFNESVSGLNLNSPVKYRGVNVGKVRDIRISHKNTKEIEVLVSITSNTPIKESTTATLNAQGITGLVFIDLSLGDERSPNLVREEGERYPVIRSKPSLFKRFESSVGNVTEKLSGMLDGTSRLLNDQNQKNIAATLDESQEFARKMNLLLDEKSIKHLHRTFESLDNITYKMDTVIIPKVERMADKGSAFTDSVSGSMASVASSYKVIQASMAEFNRAISSGEFNIKEISKNTLENLDGSLESLQNVMTELDNILKKYENSPNDFLFKKQEIKKGPGE
ncbi:MlaD family protein [Sulfurimonas sp. HSL-1716]|uniref:MlaD family protein n=1 Tax=Hydrocurvibacter sulfurireducens TaxID=3131937 RepID=UPI0031F8A4CF